MLLNWWAHLSAYVLPSCSLPHSCLLCWKGSGNRVPGCSLSVNLVRGRSGEVSRADLFSSSYPLTRGAEVTSPNITLEGSYITWRTPAPLPSAARTRAVLLPSRDQKPPETQRHNHQAQRRGDPPPAHHLPPLTTRKRNEQHKFLKCKPLPQLCCSILTSSL